MQQLKMDLFHNFAYLVMYMQIRRRLEANNKVILILISNTVYVIKIYSVLFIWT